MTPNLQQLATEIGVDLESLEKLGVTRDDSGWLISERNADGKIIGKARRFDDGKKGFVSGGHRGLTLAWPLHPYAGTSAEDPIIVVEGMTDTAAGMSIGLTTVGRPSATGGADHLAALLKGRHVVIVGEHDDGVGHTGAYKIADALVPVCASVKVIFPPEGVKDLRVWVVEHNADKDEVLAAIRGSDFYDGRTWPDVRPLPAELPGVQAYRADMLPRALQAYVDDVADRLQCPPDFVAVSVLSVLGTVIGRRCGIRPKRLDNWIVIPNLWGGVIGRPSLLKSPAIKGPMSFLDSLEADAREHYEAEMAEYGIKSMIAEVRKKDTERRIRAAIRGDEDPSAVVADLDSCKPTEPTRIRFKTNDATVEKLGEILAVNPAGVMVFRDELVGLFHGLEKDNQQGARAFYLEAWDGSSSFTYDRIGRGTVEIDSAVITVFGGIQPGRLAPYIRGAVNGGTGDDGLLQRFQLLVWPDTPKNWKNVDRLPDTEARRRVYMIVNRLVTTDWLSQGAEVDESNDDRTPFLRFDEPAQELCDCWREALERQLRSGKDHPAVEAHLGKYRSLAPSLALIFHLAEYEGGPVGAESVALAMLWAEYLESHARRVYSAATAAEVVAARSIWRRIEAGELPDGFDARKVYRKGWTGLTDPEMVKSSLDLLVDHGHLVEQWTTNPSPPRGGRPTAARYEINPTAQTKRPTHLPTKPTK